MKTFGRRVGAGALASVSVMASVTAAVAPPAVARTTVAVETPSTVCSFYDWTRRPDYYGTTNSFRGRVFDVYLNGRWVPRAGTQIRLFRAPQNTNRWTYIRTLWTDAQGWYGLTVTRSVPYDYGIQCWAPSWRDWFPHEPFKCEPSCPVVLRKPLFDKIASGPPGTKTILATGRIYPAPPKRYPVYLQIWVPSSRTWRNLAVGYTAGGNAVTVSARVGASTFYYRLYAPFSNPPPYGAGVSGVRQFRHLG